MFDIIHILAKEYGWSKRHILEELYIDEVEFYTKRIQRDRANERLTDLAIIHNPNSNNPNKLISTFKNTLQKIDGKDYLMKERMTKQDEANLMEIARRMKANAAKRQG